MDARPRPQIVRRLPRLVAATNSRRSSTRGRRRRRGVESLLLLEEPANIDAGEIADKGYVNQRAVLERRADLVARLLAARVDADVIVPTARAAP
jgi:feruloyl-CoA synthase